MNEKEIIKSKRFNVIIVSIVLVVLGIIGAITYLIIDNNKYAEPYKASKGHPTTMNRYSSPLDMAMKQDGALKPVLILVPVVCLILAVLIYLMYSKIEMTVTDKRVYGRTVFGKRVDLPLDSITAVGTSLMKGIAVTTASGAIKFKFIKNRDEIHSEISKLLLERQDKEKPAAAPVVKQEVPQSAADELVKFKTLLDQGVITQEEFDAKKKTAFGAVMVLLSV